MKICDCVKGIYGKYVEFLNKYAASILLLSIRIWIGLVFFRSGMTKFANVDQAIFLFEYEYSVPFLSPTFAAISSMAVEIGCGFAVIAGLLSRIAVLPLIGLVLVIQFLVIQNIEHYYWLFLLSTIAVYGGGHLSVDALAKKFCCKK